MQGPIREAQQQPPTATFSISEGGPAEEVLPVVEAAWARCVETVLLKSTLFPAPISLPAPHFLPARATNNEINFHHRLFFHHNIEKPSTPANASPAKQAILFHATFAIRAAIIHKSICEIPDWPQQPIL